MFKYFNPMALKPQLVTKVVTNSELSRSEKESLYLYYKTNVFDRMSPVHPVSETSEPEEQTNEQRT